MQVNRDEDDIKRRQRRRPDDAGFIVVLFDGSANDARRLIGALKGEQDKLREQMEATDMAVTETDTDR